MLREALLVPLRESDNLPHTDWQHLGHCLDYRKSDHIRSFFILSQIQYAKQYNAPVTLRLSGLSCERIPLVGYSFPLMAKVLRISAEIGLPSLLSQNVSVWMIEQNPSSMHDDTKARVY